MSRTTDLAGLLTTALGVPVVLSHQEIAGAPRPAATYGTVRFVSSSRAGAAPNRFMAKGSGLLTQTERRTGIAQLDVYGPGALDIAESLSLAIRTQATRLAARAAGINLTDGPGDVLELPQLLDTSHEEHAQAELRVQWIASATEAMERIETVEATVEVKDASETTLETMVITAP